MASDNELAIERALLRRDEANARRKMRRLDQKNHARIAGTKHDPTLGADPKRLTLKQVKAKRERLAKFNSRETQFYADAAGRLIDPKVIKRYESVMAKANAEVLKAYQDHKNRLLPPDSEGRKKTVNTRHVEMRTKLSPVQKRQLAVNDVSKPHRIPPKSFGNQVKLEAYINYIESITGQQRSKRLSRAREEFEAMVQMVGDQQLKEKVNKLSPKQFELLWFHSNFAQSLKERYANVLDTKKQEADNKVVAVSTSNAEDATHSWAEWAATKKYGKKKRK